MAHVLVTESYLEDIADAIRGKLDSETLYYPSQMASAISGIPAATVSVDGEKLVLENLGTVSGTTLSL